MTFLFRQIWKEQLCHNLDHKPTTETNLTESTARDPRANSVFGQPDHSYGILVSDVRAESKYAITMVDAEPV